MMKKLLCVCLAAAMLLGLFAAAPVVWAASEMKASEDCIATIKLFEGFSGKPYLDSDGLYTIGYGTRCPAELVEQYMQTPMTEEEADAELRLKLADYESAVNRFIDCHVLTYEQRQFDAVVSLVFNCGTSWLTKGGTLIRALSGGAEGNDLIYAFSIYSMSNGVRSLGHVRRRLAEANIYLNGEYGFSPPDHYGYVIYDAQGGTISTYNVQGYNTDLTAMPIATANRVGYIFKGWSPFITGGEPVEILDATTKNATLYAMWEADPNYVPPEEPDPEIPLEPSVPDDGIPDGTPIDSVTVTVIGNSVNLRKGPGLSYAVVGSANSGTQYAIVATYEADGYLWGKFHSGWIALSFTDYDRSKSCEHAYTVSASQSATCTVDGYVIYTCEKCGDSYTETIPARGHDFGNATCTAPQTCTVCGGTKGEALGHKYSDATCTAPQTCTVCGGTKGEALGHKYSDATCTAPQTCTVCGGTKGEALGHKYSDATCTAPQTCTVCGGTHGAALGHAYNHEGLCDRCGQGNPDYEMIVTKVFGTIINTDSQNVRDVPDGKLVGTLKRGDRVEILEQKIVADRLWGRCELGWVCMRSNVKLETVTEVVRPYAPVVQPDSPAVEPNPPVVEPPVTVTKTFGTVIDIDTLNVRQTPDGMVVGKLYRGDKVEILEQEMVAGRLWGRYSGGWICMRSYVALETVTETVQPDSPVVNPKPSVTVTKTFGTVVNTDTLNVRQTPDGTVVGKLYRGDKVEILEQEMVAGRLWGRYSGGWICMRSYVKLEIVENEDAAVEKGTVKADRLNVRSGAGTTYAVVEQLDMGTVVVILEKKTVDGTVWGRIEQGWISMDYIV